MLTEYLCRNNIIIIIIIMMIILIIIIVIVIRISFFWAKSKLISFSAQKRKLNWIQRVDIPISL